jgi:hypothetical protein
MGRPRSDVGNSRRYTQNCSTAILLVGADRRTQLAQFRLAVASKQRNTGESNINETFGPACAIVMREGSHF